MMSITSRDRSLPAERQASIRRLLVSSIGTAALCCLSITASHAQVSAPTAEDNAAVPDAFRPSSLKTDKSPAGFAPRGTPAGYTPNPDPRDFTGSYVTGGGGPPPGPGAGGAAGADADNLRGEAIACVPNFGSGAYSTHLVSSANRLTVIGEENHRLRRFYIGAQRSNRFNAAAALTDMA